MIYYNNRVLSQRLKINLARWKRWGREFLPPDPLGGMQSGYARQLTRDDAFTVYLGGHLVSELKFSIPEAKQILVQLHDWLVERGFYLIPRPAFRAFTPIDQPVLAYQIYITAGRAGGFVYTVRGLLNATVTSASHGRIREERYWEQVLGGDPLSPPRLARETARLLNLTEVHRRFAQGLVSRR